MRSGCVGPECAAAPNPPRARCSRLLARAARARPSPLGVRAERGEARWSTSNSYRPPRIILVRHAQSLGNVDESTYQKIPDNRVPLTGRGKEQAATCGCSLRELIGACACFVWRLARTCAPRAMRTTRRGYARLKAPYLRHAAPLRRASSLGSVYFSTWCVCS